MSDDTRYPRCCGGCDTDAPDVCECWSICGPECIGSYPVPVGPTKEGKQ